VSLKVHVKILGYIYSALACLMGLFVLVGLLAGVAQAGVVIPIFIALGAWWLNTGLGLLRLRSGARLSAIVVAVVFMIGLNGLFLFAGGKPFSTSAGWVSFHVGSMAVGVYTLVVMLLPGVTSLLR